MATATARLVQNTRFHREVLGMNSCAASGPFTFRYLGQEVRRSGGQEVRRLGAGTVVT